MTAINATAPLRCPHCSGSGRDVSEIDVGGHAAYLPCLCDTCGGTGFISAGYYRKLLRLMRQCRRSESLQAFLARRGYR
jgi:DnaJ-class molecular chaperone